MQTPTKPPLTPVQGALPGAQSSPIFSTALIVGIGHLGSSVAVNLKRHGLISRVIACDSRPEHESIALSLGHVDDILPLADAAALADLVVLAAPVGASKQICKAIAPHLRPGTTVTDVGSTKLNVQQAMNSHLPAHVHKVPAHPIAGIEKSGPTQAIAELFQNRWVVITPDEHCDETAVAKVEQLWSSCGANVTQMTAAHHDQVLAVTSHLPHLIAYCIVDTANQLGQDLKQEVIKYSAGGFRDFTRIAGSDPVMWRDVFLANRGAVLEMLGRFSEDLSDLQRAIRHGDGDILEKKFRETRAIRQTIVDAGQAGQFDPTEKP